MSKNSINVLCSKSVQNLTFASLEFVFKKHSKTSKSPEMLHFPKRKCCEKRTLKVRKSGGDDLTAGDWFNVQEVTVLTTAKHGHPPPCLNL
jgi:hypothetical protein